MTPVTLPTWAASEYAQAWLYGFVFTGVVLVTRAALRWFKRVGRDGSGGE